MTVSELIKKLQEVKNQDYQVVFDGWWCEKSIYTVDAIAKTNDTTKTILLSGFVYVGKNDK